MDYMEWLAAAGSKLIITKSISSAMRLIRNANRKGIDTVNAECLTPEAAAKMVVCTVLADRGEMKKVSVINSDAACMIIEDIIRSVDWDVLSSECISGASVSEIYRVMNILRMNSSGELSSELALSKDVIRLIGLYEAKLKEMQLFDSCSIIREACEMMEDLNPDGSNRFAVPEGCQFSDLEMALINKLAAGKLTVLSAQGGNIEGKVHMFRAYDYVNEAAYIADAIKDKPFNEVAVYCTDESYINFIRSALGSRRIPFYVSSAVSAMENDFVNIMVMLLRWADGGYHYCDLEKVFLLPCLRVSEYYYYRRASDIGSGIEQYNMIRNVSLDDAQMKADEKLFITFIDDIAKIFEEDIEIGELMTALIDVVKKYTRYAKKPDSSVFSELRNNFRYLPEDRRKGVGAVKYLAECLSSLTLKERAVTSAVSVGRLKDNEVTERKYNFICGLSSKHFSSGNSESPVMTDREMMKILGKDESFCELSVNRAVNRQNELIRFASSVVSDSERELYLSYAVFDMVDVMDISPALVFSTLKDMFGIKDEDIGYRGYSELASGELKIPFEKKWAGIEINEDHEDEEDAAQAVEESPDEGDEDAVKGSAADEKKDEKEQISASRIDVALDCPRKYFYRYVMKAKDISFVEFSGSKWLSALEKGNIFHHTAEKYANEKLIGQPFGDTADEARIEELVKGEAEIIKSSKQPPNERVYNEEVRVITEAAKKYFNALHAELKSSSYMVTAAEKAFENFKMTVTDPDDNSKTAEIVLRGSIDRVDTKTDGTATRVVDYKTSSDLKKFERYKHSQNVIYSKVQQAETNNVSGFYFALPFSEKQGGNVYAADFNDDDARVLAKIFIHNEFESGLGDAAAFKCRYCKFEKICRDRISDKD